TGELTGTWKEDRARFGGGHELKVPLFSRSLFQDSYSYREEGTSGSRFTGIEITGGNFASGVSSEAMKGQNGLSQTWDIHSSFRPSEWISWSISGDFNQFSPAYDPEPSNYFNDWINDFVLILPLPAESGETPSRRGSVEVSSSLGETGQPLKLSTISDFEVTGISERSRKDSLNCRLELPFPLISPSGKELLLKIIYGKVLTRTAENSPAGDFLDDSGRYFQSIGKMTPLLSTLPLMELFDPGIYSSFSSLTGDSWMASMNPEFILSLSRSYGSSINDLFIPYLWETSISRQMTRNGDTLGDDLVVSLIAYNRALNLFGKMGIHPLFSFYLTDEFSSSITYLGNFSRETAGINNLIQTTGYLTLFGTEERQLDIDASFSVSWPELFTVSGDIGTKVSWKQRTEKTLNNPLTGEGEYPLSFLHTVSFSIEGEYAVTPLFLTEGGFSSKLLIGDIASISGTLLAGVQWEKPAPEQIIFRWGVNGIIEAKLSF
ncbi:MAG: hypothetical protein KAU17_10880, partial [Spirochaetales bacterium]|nr:hypothetical protein [Spirochaetales bacterium]